MHLPRENENNLSILLAMEGNCQWFWKYREHLHCKLDWGSKIELEADQTLDMKIDLETDLKTDPDSLASTTEGVTEMGAWLCLTKL